MPHVVMSLRERLVKSNAYSLRLLVGLGIIAVVSNLFLMFTGKSVDHTHAVIQKANAIQAAAVDMETGMRGYMLAGDEVFLEPYNDGKERFIQLVDDMQKTVDDNPPQVALIGEAGAKIKEWNENVVIPFVDMRRQIGTAPSMNDMTKVVAEGKGKQFFDNYRSKIATFIAAEEKLLTERSERAVAAEKNRAEAQALIHDSRSWIDHTVKVIAQAENIIAAAVDMETGARGFFVTGVDEFLEPYIAGGTRFSDLVDSLQVTVSDNPPQVELLGDVKKNIADWKKSVIEPNMKMRRSVTAGDTEMSAFVAEVSKKKGKVYF